MRQRQALGGTRGGGVRPRQCWSPALRRGSGAGEALRRRWRSAGTGAQPPPGVRGASVPTLLSRRSRPVPIGRPTAPRGMYLSLWSYFHGHRYAALRANGLGPACRAIVPGRRGQRRWPAWRRSASREALMSSSAAKPLTAWTVTEAGRGSPTPATALSASSVAASRARSSRTSSAGTVIGLQVQKLAATSLTVTTVTGSFLIAASFTAHSSARFALADPSTPTTIPGIACSFRPGPPPFGQPSCHWLGSPESRSPPRVIGPLPQGLWSCRLLRAGDL